MNIKRTMLLAILLSLLCSRTDAQLRTWFTLESGPQWSMSKVSDPGGYFQDANVISYMLGATVRQEIIPNLTLATGVLYIPQNDGINMIDKRPDQSLWFSSGSVMIPVRAEFTFQPDESPLCITPRIGYIYNMETPPGEPYSANSILSAPEGTTLSYSIQQLSDQPVSHLLEVGLGVSLRFSSSWLASLNLSYMTGLLGSPTSRYTLDYSDGSGNPVSTEYSSKGNSLLTSLALQVPVSNIWQNKDYRVRKRIENSVYRGKAVSKRGEMYLGGEIGSLWRAFSSSNPAVGPRSMEGGGLLRYANMHTGIYGGYMLSDELGIDLGAYYQRSSTFFALMYDHEADFEISMPAPMYLEVPLRLRYFYNAYKNKLHIVVYAGASLLTHFPGLNYSQGSFDFSYNSPTSPVPLTATTTYAASKVRNLVPVLRLGTGIEYALPMEFPMIATLYVNYMQGYSPIGEIQVSSGIPETPTVSAISYSGSGWSADLGVKIPFRMGDRGKCGKLPDRNKR